MKRWLSLAIIALLLACSFGTAGAEGKRIKNFDNMAFTVATGAVADTTFWIDIKDYDFVAVRIWVDVTSGGSGGGGTVVLQGGTALSGQIVLSALTTTPWVYDYADSLGCVVSSLTLTSTSDLNATWILAAPLELDYETLVSANTPATTMNYIKPNVSADAGLLPYEKIRVILTDTNWDAAGVVYASILYHKRSD